MWGYAIGSSAAEGTPVAKCIGEPMAGCWLEFAKTWGAPYGDGPGPPMILSVLLTSTAMTSRTPGGGYVMAAAHKGSITQYSWMGLLVG